MKKLQRRAVGAMGTEKKTLEKNCREGPWVPWALKKRFLKKYVWRRRVVGTVGTENKDS